MESPKAISLQEKAGLFSDHWSPKMLGILNDHHLKLAKIQGSFIWHSHPDSDEMFFVVEGEMTIEFRDHIIALKEGEFCVVPRGVEHRPVAKETCTILLIEKEGTINTGDAGGNKTVEDLEWI